MGKPNLGDFLKAKRKEMGITQSELASRAGISLPMVSYIENGRTAGRKTLQNISQTLGIDYLEMSKMNQNQEAKDESKG